MKLSVEKSKRLELNDMLYVPADGVNLSSKAILYGTVTEKSFQNPMKLLTSR
jgi:hypothetical protein